MSVKCIRAAGARLQHWLCQYSPVSSPSSPAARDCQRFIITRYACLIEHPVLTVNNVVPYRILITALAIFAVLFCGFNLEKSGYFSWLDD